MLKQTCRYRGVHVQFCLGSQSCKHPVCSDDLETAEEYRILKQGAASADFTELAEFLMMDSTAH